MGSWVRLPSVDAGSFAPFPLTWTPPPLSIDVGSFAASSGSFAFSLFAMEAVVPSEAIVPFTYPEAFMPPVSDLSDPIALSAFSSFTLEAVVPLTCPKAIVPLTCPKAIVPLTCPKAVDLSDVRRPSCR